MFEAGVFNVEAQDFGDLEVRPRSSGTPVHYFWDRRNGRRVKVFLLDDSRPRVATYCAVTLLKKGDHFSPRLELSIRSKQTGELAPTQDDDSTNRLVRARVDLDDCHENFWKLVDFINSLAEVEVPAAGLAVVGAAEGQLVSDIQSRGPESVKSILRTLAKSPGISLSQSDISELLDRKGKLREFAAHLTSHADHEQHWQHFFSENKWIFGYGLNYQILGLVEDQPAYGGTRLDGKGGQRGDYLTATAGDARFTVLVEIKTPGKRLLAGQQEVRSGTWSLSQDLTDGVSQLQANAHRWEIRGASEEDNLDRLERERIFTVRPKGILVIGRLSEVEGDRSKRNTFQRFRSSIHGYEILTFDELLERARFIVRNDEGAD